MPAIRRPSCALRERLRDVYWIGGGSGAGKSTVARRLAGQYGLRRYATDDVMADHGGRILREDGPLLRAFGAMDMDERRVAEEFRLVRPLLADPGHAVWLLPTPDFRRAAFASRDPSLQFWRRTSDPDRALRNLLERDRRFTAGRRADVGRLPLPSIEVDATVTEDALVGRVADAFGL